MSARMDPSTSIIIVMGVSGSGKSTVGKALADKLGWKFEDGDDWQPKENVLKMTQGHPLTDEDRQPWLKTLHEVLRKGAEQQVGVVLACSALRHSYRQTLVGDSDLASHVVFVHLTGSREVLASRIGSRSGHFMPLALLDSQLHTLEPPDSDEHVITCDIASSIDTIVDTVIKRLASCRNTNSV